MPVSDIPKIKPSSVPPRFPYDLSSQEAIDDSVSLVRQKWEEVRDFDNHDFYRCNAGYGMTLADLKVTQLYDTELFEIICNTCSLPEVAGSDLGPIPWKERIQQVDTGTLSKISVGCLSYENVGKGSWSGKKGRPRVHYWKAWPALVTDEEFLKENINGLHSFSWSARKVVHSRLQEMKETCPKKIEAACSKVPKSPSFFSSNFIPLTIAQLAGLKSKQVHRLLPHLFSRTQAFLSNEQISGLKEEDFYQQESLAVCIWNKVHCQKQAKRLRYKLIFGCGDVEECKQRLTLIPEKVYQDLCSRASSMGRENLVALVKALSPDEFESLWSEIRKAGDDAKTKVLKRLSDEQRDRLVLEDLSSKEIRHLLGCGSTKATAESQRRFLRLSLKDQETIIRKAEFKGILRLLSREQRAGLDPNLLSQGLVNTLFPSISEAEDSFALTRRQHLIADSVSYFSKEQLEAFLSRLDSATAQFIREMDYSKYWCFMGRVNPFWEDS